MKDKVSRRAVILGATAAVAGVSGCVSGNADSSNSTSGQQPNSTDTDSEQASDSPELGETASLSHLGRYSAGVYNGGAAEIPAYDPDSQRLFVVNGDSKAIDVLSMENPENPTKEDTIGMESGSPNSVSVHDGTVAVAVENSNKQDPGRVEFYSASDLSGIGSAEAGALPDMVTFTDDGSRVLTANEGEPSGGYGTDPRGSVSVIDVSDGIQNATSREVDFSSYNGRKGSLRDRGVRIYGNGASVAKDLEPEYVATAGDTAYVTLQENNAVAVIDIQSGSVRSIKALGYKDHSMPRNALDAIDDGKIDITTQPVFGMYQPDAIGAYEVNGESYLVTADEGDAREYDALFETGVLRNVDGDYGLDTTEEDGANIDKQVDESAFGDGVLSSLEGLEATTEYGDKDGDGELEELYLFGARSFSIHDSEGNRIYNSGSLLERIVMHEQPAQFNSDDDENGMDSESVASGPEPEGLDIGTVAGSPHLFLGLEEISAIMSFDISNPEAPVFADYINTRNFGVDPEADIAEGSMSADAAGDLSPEGLTFVPSGQSPIESAMLAVCYEVSGTTSTYRVGTGTGWKSN